MTVQTTLDGGSISNIPSEISNETIISEQLSVAKEILERQKEEQTKSILTNPSAIALDTTKHESGEGMNRIKKTTRQLFNLYMTNQFVRRAVDIKASTLISRGYEIVDGDEIGRKLCKELIQNSGDVNLFRQLMINTEIAGDGFLEEIPNKSGNKIVKLKHIHPLTLEYLTDATSGKILVDSNKEPLGYVQYYLDKDGREVTVEIKGTSKERIHHFKLNSLGDEFTGLSSLQSGYDTIVRLMNMEYSAAEAAVKTANPLIIVKCNTKSPQQVALWGQILHKINGREEVFIPEGMDLSMLSPGHQNFSDYSDYFLDAVVATLGTPRSVLLGDSGGASNRAEGIVLTRHFYSQIRSDQISMEQFFAEIFKKYAVMAGFKAPKLRFNDIAEEAESLAASAIKLFEVGIITVEEARAMIGFDTTDATTKKLTNTLDKDLKASDMQTWHPGSPGSPAGSQAGEKDKQKASPTSVTSPLSE